MENFIFDCPACQASIEADESLRGTSISCPACGADFIVPNLALEAGLEIDGFKLVRRLGAGGMGEVWLAKQESLERYIALKILSPKLARDNDFISRFMQEVKMVGMLSHPNIVAAYRAGMAKGVRYLALEYVDGAELSSRLKIDKRIPERDALLLTKSLAEALSYAWKKFKVLHRDIKPENIMISVDGSPKLMDLGISKSMAEDNSLTMTGVVMGTPYYMSPEQARAEKTLDCRADIYSLGATLFHMLVGAVPYDGPTALSIIAMHLSPDPTPSPRLANSEVSPQCAALVKLMMAKDKSRRPPDWDAVLRDIDLVLAGEYPEPVASPASAQPQPAESEEGCSSARGGFWRRLHALPVISWTLRLILYGIVVYFLYLLWHPMQDRRQEALPGDMNISVDARSQTQQPAAAAANSEPKQSSVEKPAESQPAPPVPAESQPKAAAETPAPAGEAPAPQAQELQVASKEAPRQPSVDYDPEKLLQEQDSAFAGKSGEEPGKSSSREFGPLQMIAPQIAFSLLAGMPERVDAQVSRALKNEAFAPYKDSLEEIRKTCAGMKAADDALLLSLQKRASGESAKRTVKLFARPGDFKVVSVDPDTRLLQLVDLSNGSKLACRFNDLALGERLSHAEAESDAVKNAISGVFFLHRRMMGKARESFEGAGELGRMLIAMSNSGVFKNLRPQGGPRPPDDEADAQRFQRPPRNRPEDSASRAEDSKPKGVKGYFNGEVESFDPKTLEISLRYDFLDSKQADDWEVERGPAKIKISRGKLSLVDSEGSVSEQRLCKFRALFDSLSVSARCSYKGNGFSQGLGASQDDSVSFIVGGFGNMRDGFAKGAFSNSIPLWASNAKPGESVQTELFWDGSLASFSANGRVWSKQKLSCPGGASFRVGLSRTANDYFEIRVKGRLNKTWLASEIPDAAKP